MQWVIDLPTCESCFEVQLVLCTVSRHVCFIVQTDMETQPQPYLGVVIVLNAIWALCQLMTHGGPQCLYLWLAVMIQQ